MPTESLEPMDGCPKGCPQESCDAIYAYFKQRYDECADQTCRDSIRDQYKQAWETCTVPANA